MRQAELQIPKPPPRSKSWCSSGESRLLDAGIGNFFGAWDFRFWNLGFRRSLVLLMDNKSSECSLSWTNGIDPSGALVGTTAAGNAAMNYDIL